MQIIGKKLSLSEFQKYVLEKDFGTMPPTFLVIHHTWKPTKEDWRGEKTLNGIKSYYEGMGWSAGPHLFVAEDGIWLFTDMYDVGIHAGDGNGTLKGGYSIGIEVVGDYDNEMWSGETKKNALGVIRTLMGRLSIPEGKMTFHRDWNSTKSCPGKAITKEWILKNLNEDESMEIPSKLKDELGKYGIDVGDNIDGEKDLMTIKEGLSKRRDETDEEIGKLNGIIDSQKSGLDKATTEIEELSKRPDTCPVPKEVIKEVIKEVPVEVVKEVIKEVPVEVVKEVSVDDLSSVELFRLAIKKAFPQIKSWIEK